MTDIDRPPKGWKDEQVHEVLAHYEGQSEDDAVLEDERMAGGRAGVLMWVPAELANEIRALIARWRGNAA